MRLDELKPSHSKQLRTMETLDSAINDMITYLTDNGYVEIGKGSFSLVYAQPNSQAVIKISKSYGDACWLSFVDFIHKNPSKHYPKITNVRVYREIDNRKIFYCYAEKLKPLSAIPKTSENLPIFAFLLAELHIDILGDWEKYIGKRRATAVDVYDAATVYHDYESLRTAIRKAKKGMPRRCDFDLYENSNNIMWRERTNTLVITDPYF